MPWGRRLGSLILPWHQAAGSRVIREAQRGPSPELRRCPWGFSPPQLHPPVLGHSRFGHAPGVREAKLPSQKVGAEAWPPSRAGVNLF